MKYYDVGKIMNTHGIKGEVKVESLTDFPQLRFAKGATLYLKERDHRLCLTVANSRKQMKWVLLRFKGYDNINQVLFMKRHVLQIKQSQQSNQDLKPGQYFYRQIIGLSVFDVKGHRLGRITHIMKTGANDVWVVKRDRQPALLLPKISQVIKKVDLPRHRVVVELMRGMK